jgi:tetrahydromethanopterin S-methyltransferase subunit E
MIWLVIIYSLVVLGIIAAYTIPNHKLEVRKRNKYQE